MVGNPEKEPRTVALADPVERQLQVDILKFVYEQRLRLLNVRQEHEWKIFFAVAVLLGGVDAAILTNNIILVGYKRYLWIFACVLAGVACVGYEVGLQRRNRTDRRVLDEVCRRLSVLGGVQSDTPVTWGVESPFGRKHEEDLVGLWAFRWQVLVTGLIVGVSASVPFLRW